MRLCTLRTDPVCLPIVIISLSHDRAVQGGATAGTGTGDVTEHLVGCCAFELLVTTEEVAGRARLCNAGLAGVFEPVVGLRLST